jgi:soluble lytic murein transglycosylase-like protein
METTSSSDTNLTTSLSFLRSRFLVNVVICSFLLSFSASVEARSHKQHKPSKAHVSSSHKKLPKVPVEKVPIETYINKKFRKHNAREITAGIFKAAKRFRLDPYLIAGIIQRESGFQTTVNNNGNYGLMQIDLSANSKVIALEHANGRMHIPEVNIAVGSRILRECLDTSGEGQILSAVALYNKGCSPEHVASKIQRGLRYANLVFKHSKQIKLFETS